MVSSLGSTCAQAGTQSPQEKGCTEWVTRGSGVPQGGPEGSFLYMLAMLQPLMRWIAREYPQLARAPHTSPLQAHVDDAVPMAHHIGFYDVQKSQNLQHQKNHPFK